MAAGVSCDAKERRTRASKGLCVKIGGPRSKTDRDPWKKTFVEGRIANEYATKGRGLSEKDIYGRSRRWRFLMETCKQHKLRTLTSSNTFQ